MRRYTFISFMIGLLVGSAVLAIPIYILEQKVSELSAEKENMKRDLVGRFTQKCDPILLQEILKALENNIDRIFPTSIQFSHELSTSEIETLRSSGVGFVSLNNSVVHEEEVYSACGSLRALIEAASSDDVIEINYMFDETLSSGTYYEGAFANVSEYAEVTVQPSELSVGQWATISLRNTHPTKSMAFTLIVYQEFENGSQVEIFSTAKPVQGAYDQPYLFLDPNSTFELDFPAENAGRFFITPKMVFFTVTDG